MKKKIILITGIVLVAALCVLGTLYFFTDVLEIPLKQNQTSGTLLTKETNKKTPYLLDIVKYDDLDNENVKNWVTSKKESGKIDGQSVYYTMYDNDFNTPIYMYLFMPDAKELMGDVTMSGIKAGENGEAVVLNVDIKDNISRTKESTDLIFRVYAEGSLEEAAATIVQLKINGKTYDCPAVNGSSYTKLK